MPSQTTYCNIVKEIWEQKKSIKQEEPFWLLQLWLNTYFEPQLTLILPKIFIEVSKVLAYAISTDHF